MRTFYQARTGRRQDFGIENDCQLKQVARLAAGVQAGAACGKAAGWLVQLPPCIDTVIILAGLMARSVAPKASGMSFMTSCCMCLPFLFALLCARKRPGNRRP